MIIIAKERRASIFMKTGSPPPPPPPPPPTTTILPQTYDKKKPIVLLLSSRLLRNLKQLSLGSELVLQQVLSLLAKPRGGRIGRTSTLRAGSSLQLHAHVIPSRQDETLLSFRMDAHILHFFLQRHQQKPSRPLDHSRTLTRSTSSVLSLRVVCNEVTASLKFSLGGALLRSLICCSC